MWMPTRKMGGRSPSNVGKIAVVALVNKMRAILLIEGDYNYFNKWAFGQEAINTLYEMGYIPEEQYSQKESTAEDATMDNRLTMDILPSSGILWPQHLQMLPIVMIESTTS